MQLKSCFLKGLSAIAIAVTVAMGQIPNTDWYTIPPGGIDGSADKPYEISNADELAGLAKLVNGNGVTAVNFSGKHIVLTRDIDLADYGKGETSWNGGRGWIPIGYGGTRSAPREFRGIFEGNDKKIANLYINGTVDSTRSLGLFGRINGGSVQNLGVVGVEIIGIGTITGGSDGIRAIRSYGGISGVVGYSNGTIANCYSTGTVSGNISLSGQGGWNNAYAYSYGGIGGVVGNSGGTITNCYSTITVSGNISISSGSYSENYGGIGGVAGYSNGTITNGYSTGTVNGSKISNNSSSESYSYGGIGGVVGYVSGGTIIGSYSTSAINGSSSNIPNNRFGVGGVIGYRTSGTISNCVALNPSITRDSGTGTNYNRVLGYISTNTNLSRNIAYSDLGAGGGITFVRDDRYGTNITAAAIISDATMDGRFTEANGWTIENGKLPGLFGQAVDLPEHFIQMFDDGDGTEAAPYEISLPAQLVRLAQAVNGGNNFTGVYIKLTADINLAAYGKGVSSWNNGRGWVPIGNHADRSFQGNFDGDGKTISNLFINSTANYAGLFGHIEDGSVLNVNVVGMEITATGNHVGGVVGYVNGGRVENCRTAGTIGGTGSYVGGVVGNSAADVAIVNCNSTSTVSGASYLGGVAGHVAGSITDSYSTGAVTGTGSHVGGLVGSVAGSMARCYSTGAVSSTGSGGNVGGVAGHFSGGAASGCYSAGPVSGTIGVGGVIGYVDGSGTVSGCYSIGPISGNRTVGGVVGNLWSGSIANCAALNPSITRATGSFTDFGRVAGYVSTSGATVSDNTAFATMELVADGSLSFTEKTANGKDGADIAVSAINADGSIGGRFAAADGWTVENGRLPGLFGAAVEVPAHLRTSGSLVNALAPTITTQPVGGTVAVGGSRSLSVAAAVADGGTLSYQWFSNTTASNTGGTSISGATSASYSVSASAAGTFYYYVVVTNTNNGATGGKTAVVASSAVTVVVNVPVVNAAVPLITAEPQNVSVEVGAAVSLSVAASSPDGGVLSYQWYGNSTASNTGGTAISGATGTTFIPGTGEAGASYYYVVVTNTNPDVNGVQTAVSTSRTATVAVTAAGVVDAQFPTVSGPGNLTLETGDNAVLTITASSLDGGTLSYQWYGNSTANNAGGVVIAGAMEATFVPSTSEKGTFYYYAEVTNTNTGVNGAQTAASTSRVAVVTVNDAPVSVATTDREVPQNDTNQETAIVAPVNVLTTRFTVGPNPVGKSSGAVNFFYQGKRIDNAVLTIYDASGNVVNSVRIADDSTLHTPDSTLRQVGSWNLTDRKGRPVAEGTYLVRGVITTLDGKAERVSVMVGVR